jgi:hypothetical protein
MGQRSQPLSPCLTTHRHDVLRPASLEPAASAGAIAASRPWTGRTGCAPGSGEARQPRRCAGAGGVRIQGKRPLPARFRSRPAGDRQGGKDRTRRADPSLAGPASLVGDGGRAGGSGPGQVRGKTIRPHRRCRWVSLASPPDRTWGVLSSPRENPSFPAAKGQCPDCQLPSGGCHHVHSPRPFNGSATKSGCAPRSAGTSTQQAQLHTIGPVLLIRRRNLRL